jgi:hypothetical protein
MVSTDESSTLGKDLHRPPGLPAEAWSEDVSAKLYPTLSLEYAAQKAVMTSSRTGEFMIVIDEWVESRK